MVIKGGASNKQANKAVAQLSKPTKVIRLSSQQAQQEHAHKADVADGYGSRMTQAVVEILANRSEPNHHLTETLIVRRNNDLAPIGVKVLRLHTVRDRAALGATVRRLHGSSKVPLELLDVMLTYSDVQQPCSVQRTRPLRHTAETEGRRKAHPRCTCQRSRGHKSPGP